MTKLLVKVMTGPLVRHVLAALSGWLMCDASRLSTLFLAAVTWLATVLASFLLQRFPALLGGVEMDGPEGRELVRMAVGSIVRQLIAGITGWLMAHGYAGDPESTAGVLAWLANYASSKAPKATAKAGK